MFKGVYKTGNGWRIEIQAGGTIHSLTLEEAWKLALEIIQAVKANYSEREMMHKYTAHHNRGND